MTDLHICTGSWSNGDPCTHPQKFEDRCGFHKREGVRQNKNPKCIGFFSNGEPCTYDKKIGDLCGTHAKKIIPKEKEEDDGVEEHKDVEDTEERDYNLEGED